MNTDERIRCIEQAQVKIAEAKALVSQVFEGVKAQPDTISHLESVRRDGSDQSCCGFYGLESLKDLIRDRCEDDDYWSGK